MDEQTGIFFISEFNIPRQNARNDLRMKMEQKLRELNIKTNDETVAYYTGNTAFSREVINSDKTIYYGIVDKNNELIKIVKLNNEKLKEKLEKKEGNHDRLNPPQKTDDLNELVEQELWG